MTENLQTQFQIERCETLAQLDALEKEWSDLLDEISDAPIYLTWEWIRTWWIFFGQDRQLWLLTARDKQGKLHGLAPFMGEKYQKGLIKLNMIVFIGIGCVCPTNLKILGRPDDMERLYLAFLEFLLGQSDQWDVLRISFVVEGSSEENLLQAAGGSIRIGARMPSGYISLPGNWESYLRNLRGKFRRDLKSSRSKLESDYPGIVEFSYITDPEELDSAMDQLEDLVKRRCHAKGLTTDWDDLTFTRFHRTITHLALSCGWLRFFTLKVEDRVIALVYNFLYHDCYYGYNMGFEFDWNRYNPGHLLIAFCIQTAILEGAERFEMGRGRADHKTNWTDSVRIENEILFRRNWRGGLWIKLGNIWRGLKFRAK